MFSCEFFEISKNTFFTEHLWITASELFQFNWYLCVQSHRFLFCTPSSKTRVKSALFDNLYFWLKFACVNFCVIMYGLFPNSPLTAIDTVIIRSTHPALFCKKGVLKRFAIFTRKHLESVSMNLQICNVKLYQKRDYATVVFL